MSEFGMCEELRRTRIYVHLEKIINIFTPREKALFRLDLNHVILYYKTQQGCVQYCIVETRIWLY
jgi:hypothetical protein